MDLRTLGNIGFRVSPIGFGAFKIGRNIGTKYQSDYELPSDDEVDHLLNTILDLGINLIDTAPAYGTSEERIGRSISHRRSEFVLSTKVGERFENGRSTYDFSRSATNASIDESLDRLRADHLDIVLIHSDGRDLEIMNDTDVVDTLRARQEAGDIGGIGLSGKTPKGALAALEWADVLMIEYHPGDTSHAEVIERAHQSGAGVLIKKGLASGTLDPATSIAFILGNPAVHSLIIGGLNPAHIEANIAAAARAG